MVVIVEGLSATAIESLVVKATNVRRAFDVGTSIDDGRGSGSYGRMFGID